MLLSNKLAQGLRTKSICQWCPLPSHGFRSSHSFRQGLLRQSKRSYLSFGSRICRSWEGVWGGRLGLPTPAKDGRNFACCIILAAKLGGSLGLGRVRVLPGYVLGACAVYMCIDVSFRNRERTDRARYYRPFILPPRLDLSVVRHGTHR